MSFVPLSHALHLLSAVTFFCTSLFPLLLLCHSFLPFGHFSISDTFSYFNVCTFPLAHTCDLLLILSLLLLLAISSHPYFSLSILLFCLCYFSVSIICPLASGMLFLPDVLVLPFPHRFLSKELSRWPPSSWQPFRRREGLPLAIGGAIKRRL